MVSLYSRRRSRPTSSKGRRLSLSPIPEDESCRDWELEPAPPAPKASTQRRSSTPSFYALIDHERHLVGLPRLRRSSDLEQLALRHALTMALAQTVVHSVENLAQLQHKLGSLAVGENVQRGRSLYYMHQQALQDKDVNYHNMVGATFLECGAAMVKGEDGQLYMCQLFR